MLTVPVLVACGVPVLSSLAAAQAQSVVIASVGTPGYLAQGVVSWSLALLIGIPELCGVLIGWKIAHAVPHPQAEIRAGRSTPRTRPLPRIARLICRPVPRALRAARSRNAERTLPRGRTAPPGGAWGDSRKTRPQRFSMMVG